MASKEADLKKSHFGYGLPMAKEKSILTMDLRNKKTLLPSILDRLGRDGMSMILAESEAVAASGRL